VALVALFACAVGAPAHAATTAPTLLVQVIGQGTVTGTGINCGGGNLSCYSAYGSGGSVTLTATPASGWSTPTWEGACGASTTCAVTPTTGSGTTATVVFSTTSSVQTSTLTVASANGDLANGSTAYPIECDSSSTPPAGADCSLTVFAGSTLTMAETPDSTYVFGDWGGACSGSGPSCSVYLTSSQSVSASFLTAASTTLTVVVTGNGSVSGGGINCGSGATCSTPEPPNASVTLTATPLSGYALTSWSGGGCSGTQATCTVQMSASASVTAAFAPVVPLSVTVTGNGYVTGGGIGCDGTDLGQTCTANETQGTDITLVATANSGGGTPYWTGCLSSAGNACTISDISSATAVSVSFSGSGSTGPIATNLLAVTVHGDGYVQAFAGSNSIYCTAAGGSGCTASVPAGTSITLSAVPASRSTTDFTSWGGACTSFTSTTCTLTMSSAATVTATFVGGSTTYTLTAQVSGSGSVTGAGIDCGDISSTCSSPQAAGASVTLTASPDFGASFTGWSGACSGTSTTCTVSMTTAKSVTATFSGGFGGGTSVSLTVAVTGAGRVTAKGLDCVGAAGKTKTCEGSYASGQKVTLAANPAAGYVLSAWSGGCSGKNSTCPLTLGATELVGAKFVHVELAATHKPTVVLTKRGYRVTLWFLAGERGTAQVVARRAGKIVVRHRVAVKAGGRHVLFTVSAHGRYAVTLTLAKHTLRWSVKV